MTKSIMLKGCVQIVITNMVETRSLGTAIMISYTPTVCARTATLTLTTVKEENRRAMKSKKLN